MDTFSRRMPHPSVIWAWWPILYYPRRLWRCKNRRICPARFTRLSDFLPNIWRTHNAPELGGYLVILFIIKFIVRSHSQYWRIRIRRIIDQILCVSQSPSARFFVNSCFVVDLVSRVDNRATNVLTNSENHLTGVPWFFVYLSLKSRVLSTFIRLW